MAKCLVLGANGFIGSHLVDSLVAAGNNVRAFGHFSGQTNFEESSLTEIFRGDFLNRGDLAEAVEGIEYVFHCISTTTPATAEADPLVDIDSNLKMSVELFQLCVDAGVKRVLFCSTGGAIYGESDGHAFTELDLPQPVSPYGIAKLSIEHYLRYFNVKYGLDSVSLRISNPYGERQPLHRKQGVIPIFLETICKGDAITVLGDGSMIRDYIYVKDVADMITSMFDRECKYAVYNIGSGEGRSINELISAIKKSTGEPIEVKYSEVPSTFVHTVLLDVNRFYDEFKEKPFTNLEDGITATYKYIQSEMQHE